MNSLIFRNVEENDSSSKLIKLLKFINRDTIDNGTSYNGIPVPNPTSYSVIFYVSFGGYNGSYTSGSHIAQIFENSFTTIAKLTSDSSNGSPDKVPFVREVKNWIVYTTSMWTPGQFAAAIFGID